MNTRGYGGRKIRKTARVYTNDRSHAVLNLVISGPVDKFVTVAPRSVILRGRAGDIIKERVRIIPEEKYAFKVLGARARNGRNIRFKLSQVKGAERPEYALTVENTRPTEGRYIDTVFLATNSKIQPELKIRVFGYVQPPQQAAGKKK